MKSQKLRIDTPSGRLKLIVLRPDCQSGQEGEPATEQAKLPGILWIHGGGYAVGMAAMVNVSCGKLLAEEFGAVVVSPEYRIALRAPYPAALEDCYAALLYMHFHADELGIDRDRIVVGGESAGGGLAVATCLLARDMGDVNVAMQIPLYPMLDCEDTLSSRDNHGKVWNTKRTYRSMPRQRARPTSAGFRRVIPSCSTVSRSSSRRSITCATCELLVSTRMSMFFTAIRMRSICSVSGRLKPRRPSAVSAPLTSAPSGDDIKFSEFVRQSESAGLSWRLTTRRNTRNSTCRRRSRASLPCRQ